MCQAAFSVHLRNHTRTPIVGTSIILILQMRELRNSVPSSHNREVARGRQSQCSYTGLCTAKVGKWGSEEVKPQQREGNAPEWMEQ